MIDWLTQPAPWWKFWMPQSGLPGGLIGGVLSGGMLSCLLYFFSK